MSPRREDVATIEELNSSVLRVKMEAAPSPSEDESPSKRTRLEAEEQVNPHNVLLTHYYRDWVGMLADWSTGVFSVVLVLIACVAPFVYNNRMSSPVAAKAPKPWYSVRCTRQIAS